MYLYLTDYGCWEASITNNPQQQIQNKQGPLDPLFYLKKENNLVFKSKNESTTHIYNNNSLHSIFKQK